MFETRACWWKTDHGEYSKLEWRLGELQSWVPGDALIVGQEVYGVIEDTTTGDLVVVPVPRIRFKLPE